MKIPRWLAVTLAVFVGLAAGVYWLSRAPESLTVVSWGDAYGRAQAIALSRYLLPSSPRASQQFVPTTVPVTTALSFVAVSTSAGIPPPGPGSP